MSPSNRPSNERMISPSPLVDIREEAVRSVAIASKRELLME